jgi:hypothetical protein
MGVWEDETIEQKDKPRRRAGSLDFEKEER